MSPRSVFMYRAALAGMLSLVMFFSLLPVGGFFFGLPGPDLIMCFFFAWVLRRPDYVPMGLVVLIGFFADALLMQPLGLWTVILLIATETLRRGVQSTEVLTPVDEAFQVVTVMLACFLAERLALMILLADAPALSSQLVHILMTVLFYPVIVLVTHTVFGVRRLQPGEVDALGGRP